MSRRVHLFLQVSTMPSQKVPLVRSARFIAFAVFNSFAFYSGALALNIDGFFSVRSPLILPPCFFLAGETFLRRHFYSAKGRNTPLWCLLLQGPKSRIWPQSKEICARFPLISQAPVFSSAFGARSARRSAEKVLPVIQRKSKKKRRSSFCIFFW